MCSSHGLGGGPMRQGPSQLKNQETAGEHSPILRSSILAVRPAVHFRPATNPADVPPRRITTARPPPALGRQLCPLSGASIPCRRTPNLPTSRGAIVDHPRLNRKRTRTGTSILCSASAPAPASFAPSRSRRACVCLSSWSAKRSVAAALSAESLGTFVLPPCVVRLLIARGRDPKSEAAVERLAMRRAPSSHLWSGAAFPNHTPSVIQGHRRARLH